MNTQSSEQILNNRLQVKTSIDVVRWLAFQGFAFRGHDETPDSKNRGNFLEMLKLLVSYNDKVGKLVLENAPKSSKYTSPKIQKEILEVLAKKVRNKIREDVGNSKFCIIVDEARDEFKRLEQMTIILRFVDDDGFIQERFFDLVHVKDILALTLKNEISAVISHHCLDIQNIYGQGYDGASNMRGEWKELQALFFKDCPYAYYVHCFAHRLQIALVVTSREAIQIAHMIAIDELESGKGINQIGTVKRADFHMQELDSRLGEGETKLLALSSALDPNDAYRSFNIDDICCLAEKYYSLDFSENEKINLRFQLKYFKVDVLTNPKFQSLSSIADLCRRLLETEK
ncbi:zinc finger MYM-type protein 1-like [Juglans microcarpa x Juglans regia]|uniref:zinc finger MYM-type protein 1-like n=1 Tax=Juglans microcarpa x Juglans regia TaxID=2249226 RepID=UPI001B7E1713|nr:zinc finger MYM-type protein 1-like [Juglans microcarpa x Juglans regia]